jgi:hypothetical protein
VLLDNIAYPNLSLTKQDGPELFYQAPKLRDSLKLSSGIFINKIHLSEYFAFQMIQVYNGIRRKLLH